MTGHRPARRPTTPARAQTGPWAIAGWLLLALVVCFASGFALATAVTA